MKLLSNINNYSVFSNLYTRFYSIYYFLWATPLNLDNCAIFIICCTAETSQEPRIVVFSWRRTSYNTISLFQTFECGKIATYTRAKRNNCG